MSKRLASFTQPPSSAQPIQLLFEDGTRATCDFLVGADGVKSTVRACMLAAVAGGLRAQGKTAEADEALRAAPPVWSGTMAYRTTIPSGVLHKRFPNHRVLSTPQLVRTFPRTR